MRDFTCILCRRPFSMFYGDLIVTEDLICEECRAEFRRLEGDALRRYIFEHLDKSQPEQEALGNRIVQTMERLKQRGPDVKK
ncbi:MAG: hypothetical protein JW953_19450 [Anaerolineae bacterium]|nr:hypothetical protein [Anaerolineae bacterium]